MALFLGLVVTVTQAQDAVRPNSPTDGVSSPPTNQDAPAAPVVTAPIPSVDLAPPANSDEAGDNEPASPPVAATVVPATPPRAQVAVLRVLDKVTAETMAFAAPIGQRVRYKNLVFEVKTCVTRGVGDPEPNPSAYLIITSDAGAATGALLGPREVFRGWMFANAPGLHPLKHPVYDAWLVSCNASLPPT